MTEVFEGKEQKFQSGYALPWHSVRIVPEGAEVVSIDDPWLIRIERGNGRGDLFVTPDKTMDGNVLVLSKTFTPEQTKMFAEDKELIVVVEHGTEAAIRPRMFHKLILQRDFRTARTR